MQKFAFGMAYAYRSCPVEVSYGTVIVSFFSFEDRSRVWLETIIVG
jgi:hypothetical protein